MNLLGIDAGTSGCKAVIFAEDGRQLAAAYQEYDTERPRPGWAELDTPRVWAQVQETIRAVLRGGAGPVGALCVSSLGEAVVPVSADRAILGPSLLNFDTRGAEFVEEVRARISTPELYAVNGNPPGNHYSLTKLLWLQKYQPALYARADLFLHWSGFIAFMLGAEARVDATLANRTLLFDLERQDWSPDLPERFGVERSKLPPVTPAGTVIGQVSRAAAADLGLPAGIPIVAGGHDQCCTALGCGVVAPGQAMYGMGTYICMVPVFARRPDAAAMIAAGLNTEHHVAPGQYVSFIYNQGGALVKWFRDTFAAEERKTARWDLYPALMDEMPAGPSRVMALPHFTATGPPEFIDDSCGLLAGLQLDTSRGEILKGLIEGATFYMRACLEDLPAGMEISDFYAAGGGSKSDAWLQASADILGRPFQRPAVSEAGALGAAILAGAGCGVFASAAEGARRMVQPGQTFEPDPTMQRRYAGRYDLYRRLQPLLRDYLRDLARPPA
jgi:xylulokinase